MPSPLFKSSQRAQQKTSLGLLLTMTGNTFLIEYGLNRRFIHICFCKVNLPTLSYLFHRLKNILRSMGDISTGMTYQNCEDWKQPHRHKEGRLHLQYLPVAQ